MNLQTYNALAKLLLGVPQLVELYEEKSPSFSGSVKEWISTVEPVMMAAGLQHVSEISSLKARITAAERGVLTADGVTGIGRSSPTKQKYIGAVTVQCLSRAQGVLHGLLAPYEARYMEAMQVTRQMVIAATQLGLLNGFFRNDGSNGVTQLFRVFMADINLRPLATRVLELLTFEDALQVLNFSLAEWADSYKKNFEKLTS
jgi:hypothetical protein